MKKYFWSHEALVSDVDFEALFCYTVNTTVPLDPFDCIGFIFSEFFRNIWANIAEPFFYRLKIKLISLIKNKILSFFI